MAESDVRPPGAANPSAKEIYLVEIPLAVITAGEWVRKAPSTAHLTRAAYTIDYKKV